MLIKGLKIRRELQLFNHLAMNSPDEGIGKILRLNLMGFFLEFGVQGHPDSKHALPVAENLLNYQFEATAYVKFVCR